MRARQILSPGLRPRGMRGMARRKAQTYGSAILVGPRRAPFGAPHTRKRMLIGGDLSDRQAPLSPEVPRERPSHRFQSLSIPGLEERLGRSDRRRLAWALRSSASSWQGFLLSPGGAPPPPECPACETGPAGRRTPSRRATPRDGAPQWTRCAQFTGGCGGGDKTVSGAPMNAQQVSFVPLADVGDINQRAGKRKVNPSRPPKPWGPVSGESIQ